MASDCGECLNHKFLNEKLSKLQSEVDTLFDRLREAEEGIIENREKNNAIFSLLEKIEKGVEAMSEKLEVKQEKKLDWLWGVLSAVITAYIIVKIVAKRL